MLRKDRYDELSAPRTKLDKTKSALAVMIAFVVIVGGFALLLAALTVGANKLEGLLSSLV